MIYSLSKPLPFLFLFILLLSCSKEQNKELIQGVVGPKLIKTVSFGLAGGLQFASQLTYDEHGRISSENTGYANFIAQYNAQSQIIKITQTNTNGSIVVHSVVYDATGKILKKTVNGQSGVETINYTYSNGKCTGYSGADQGDVELIWEGDNVVEKLDKIDGRVVSKISYKNYDENISPYYNISDFLQIARLSVCSKNNPRQISSTVTQSSEFLYEYNEDGSVSQVVNPSSGFATQYYYIR